MQSVETALEAVVKECGSNAKLSTVRTLAEGSLSLLASPTRVAELEVHQLRDATLEPLQSALESGSAKLAVCGLNGIQLLLHDERFQSAMESELEEQWLPMQVLQAVWACPGLPDDIQVAVMKVLLDMILTTTWCMSASIIVKISHLCVAMYCQSCKKNSLLSTLNTVVDMIVHDRHYTLPPLHKLNTSSTSSLPASSTTTSSSSGPSSGTPNGAPPRTPSAANVDNSKNLLAACKMTIFQV